ncbi:MAG: hypothetical protein AAF479_06895 [Pseudomonadota bacterium]
MYRIPKAVKTDPERRWALPDRIFFACGACHILAYAFLHRKGGRTYTARWIKPAPGHAGNHIVAVSGNEAFDYHGHTQWDGLLAHIQRKSERWWPGWRYEVIELPPEVLVSEAESLRYEGLWLREPDQFLHDPLPRAERFIDRVTGWNPPG